MEKIRCDESLSVNTDLILKPRKAMQNSGLSNVSEGSVSRKFGKIPAQRDTGRKTAKTSKICNITVMRKMRCFCHTRYFGLKVHLHTRAVAYAH